jgi:hypothetical protein
VFSVVHDVLRVELIANINDGEVNINCELIRMNYADIAEESYLSIVSGVNQFFFKLLYEVYILISILLVESIYCSSRYSTKS